MIECVKNGEPIAADWTGTVKDGSVMLTDLNEAVAAPGTKEAISAAADKLNAGELKVFATDAWTVNGEHLTEYLADVDSDPNYEPDTNVISDGYFHESEFRSAPYFDLAIDGITIMNG
jgi:basic membrane protein A